VNRSSLCIMSADASWSIAPLQRALVTQERRARLGFADAQKKIRLLKAAEVKACNGETVPIRPVADVAEITEAQVRTACRALISDGRYERRGRTGEDSNSDGRLGRVLINLSW
jgi:hypothetical protein